MDFSFTDEQHAVAESAGAIFAGLATTERVTDAEQGVDRFDEALWAELARAHLLGLVVPERHGGAGLALTEACLVLEQQGRHVAPVPLWATTVLGALTVARFGTDAQQDALLPGVAEGSIRLSAALTEVGSSPHRRPAVTASAPNDTTTPNGTGAWRLDGVLLAVPQAHLATKVVVPARTDDGTTVVALVDTAAPGVELERVLTTDRQVHPHMHLRGVVVDDSDVVAGPDTGAAVVEAMVENALVGLCAIQLGVTQAALAQAAEYCNHRQQFGRPLSSFQGAMLRAADAYIDIEAIRVTTWQAAWRLDTGRDAEEAVTVAKWWASEAGQRVVHATQHLHGGLGADVDYPIHRYFLWGKQIELMLGGPSAQLAHLGDLVADELAAKAGPL